MPPKRELSIRVRAELRDALDQAVIDQGQSLTALVESALAQFLGVDGPESGQTLADRVRALEDRVATLEGTAMQRTAPHRDTTPPHPTPQTAPSPGAYRGEGEGQHPKADGDGMTTQEAWEYCLGLGCTKTKDGFRSWAKRNPADLLQQYGLEYTGQGVQGNNTTASYRKVG